VNSPPVYRLPARRAGTAIYGLTVTQLSLAATGLTVLILATVILDGGAGVLVGTVALVVAVLLATVRVGGDPLHDLLPLLIRFTVTRPHRAARTRRAAAAGGGRLPGWLHGLDLLDADPGEAGLLTIDGEPPAVIHHRATGALSVVLDVRGGAFTLADPADQHHRLAAWAGVLAQTARDPAVLSLGFTVHTDHIRPDPPPPPAGPTLVGTGTGTGTGTGSRRRRRGDGDRSGGSGAAAALASYHRLLVDTLVQHHDLYLWLTIDPHRAARTHRRGPARATLVALQAATALASRARAAGLTVHGALSPARLVAAILTQLDPHAPSPPAPDADAPDDNAPDADVTNDAAPAVGASRRHLTAVASDRPSTAPTAPPLLAATGTAPSVGLAARAALPGARLPAHPSVPARAIAPVAALANSAAFDHGAQRRAPASPPPPIATTPATAHSHQQTPNSAGGTNQRPFRADRRRRAAGTRRSALPARSWPRATAEDGLARPAAEVRAYWDAVRVGATWHRVFRVAAWPTGPLQPGWLDPLLHEAPAGRTLTTAFTPIAPAASRRRLHHDTAAIDLAIQLRDRHAVRVPVHLTRARDELDQRDAELGAGHPELAHLTLLGLAAPDRAALDAASAQLVDLAARAGIVDLRPLHGRHHHALPATLPLGLTPRRPPPGAV